MALRYDFDMVAVAPEGLPDRFGDLEATGLAGEKRAMFRDPDTVAALKRADPAVQSFFADSGFALTHHDSGTPPGKFRKADEEARVYVIERLSANLSTHKLDGANWGGFAFSEFMRALSVAEAVDDSQMLSLGSLRRPDPDVVAARIAAQQAKGRRMIAFGVLLLGVVLLFYVASNMV